MRMSHTSFAAAQICYIIRSKNIPLARLQTSRVERARTRFETGSHVSAYTMYMDGIVYMLCSLW